MPFHHHYPNLVSETTQAHTRLIRDYDGANPDFDYIVIGSGMGGGMLADELADRVGAHKRILVLDIGAFIYPTHVYNLSRIPNGALAQHFNVDNFLQYETGHHYIGGKPQMAFGGRSLFWSGLIPQAQDWEMAFFPDSVRAELESRFLSLAGQRMNESVTMGNKAQALVSHFQASSLNDDFIIQETPRALHQPYLNSDTSPSEHYQFEPTGVFNTAELLVNQMGLTPGADQNGNGLFLKLNSFVEGIHHVPHNWYEVRTTHTVTGQPSRFYALKVVIAAGATESSKLIHRSDIFHELPEPIRQQVGFGLTDHPVTGESQILASSLGSIPITRRDHAKIIFYSRGHQDAHGNTRFPFNIEMNVNHEYWHLRDNDPSEHPSPDTTSKSRIDIKFSFANCLDDSNGIHSHAFDAYRPAIQFKRFAYLDDLLNARFPAVAGWQKTQGAFFDLLNTTRDRVFSEFNAVERLNGDYGGGHGQQWPFGWGTVHHACGTLRMPWKSHRLASFNHDAVVDENLKIHGSEGIYACDMSVMPISTAANPVRSLGGLALRLAGHLTQ